MTLLPPHNTSYKYTTSLVCLNPFEKHQSTGKKCSSKQFRTNQFNIFDTLTNKLIKHEAYLLGELTYPTWGSSENHRLKMPFFGDMLVSWRKQIIAGPGTVAAWRPSRPAGVLRNNDHHLELRDDHIPGTTGEAVGLGKCSKKKWVTPQKPQKFMNIDDS